MAAAARVFAAALIIIATGTGNAMTITVGQTDGDLVGSDSRVLQSAVDRVHKGDGGTVYIKSGTYTMYNSLYLRSGVNVIGLGPSPLLEAAESVTVELAEDAGYGLAEIVVRDASGLRPGMGVTFSDDTHNSGWYVNVRTITEVEGNTIRLDEELDLDYLVARKGKVQTTFPIIFGKRVQRVRLENLTVDGNRSKTAALNGCRGGAIYFWKSEHCTIDACKARNFNGDGISYQVSPYITVTRCKSYRNASLGIHPGSGSHHTEVANCSIHDNGGIGLFLCWRVKDSEFTDNVIEHNGRDGISIGHKDTDNLFAGNTVELNGRHGVHFRAESETNGGHRNIFEDNYIRDNGQDEAGDGIHIDAVTYDIEISGNTIEDTARDGRVTQRNGIFVAEGVDGVKTRGNTIRGHLGEAIVNESEGARNSLQL